MPQVIKHYGTPRHSGRYPWGSGKDPEQRNKSFLGQIRELEKQGLSEIEIANSFGMSTTQLRRRKTIEKQAERSDTLRQIIKLKEKGYSQTAIGERLGLNESTVRYYLSDSTKEKIKEIDDVSEILRGAINKQGPIDIGLGVENHLAINRTKLAASIAKLEAEGYKVQYIKERQLGTGKYTWIKVLTPPGMTYSEMYSNRDKISMPDLIVGNKTEGINDLGLRPPQSVDSKRIFIRYGDEGGTLKDGVIELRRNVEDLSLGNSRYAQVRIAVDDKHYMKGMSLYSDDIPDGYDIVYNTNKPKGTPPEKVFKGLKDDPDNPFGSVIKKDGQKGAINIVYEEGDWNTWSKTISSQVLSKQNPSTAKKQLDLSFDLQKEEFDEIMSLTNPTVKAHLLSKFADGADAAAVHLKAAALPRQRSQVILPLDINENEIYAPNFKNGESVVLIRHPHGSITEIPELIVNNKNSKGKSVLGDAQDAIGIHPKVAERMSGADFDGDTVLVIPNKNKNIKTAPPLASLKGFDHKALYKKYPGMEVMSEETKQLKMGEISNLITDMTIKGASQSEIARAIKHSMVVIDAPKHELDYKASYIDNGIAQLREKYQGGSNRGASTLISKAKSKVYVNERKDNYKIDPKTGEKIFEETGNTFVNKQGKLVRRLQKTTLMAEKDDAYALSSGTKIESVYADYANSLKQLANKARLTITKTKPLEYSPSARETFASEVRSLKAKLDLALRNAPLERKAQLVANKIVSSKKTANPDLTPAQIKKIKGMALTEARRRVGARKEKIIIEDKEWEAIQAGAISNSTLIQILKNSDDKVIKTRAMPRRTSALTPARRSRATEMLARGYTRAEVAEALGISISTLDQLNK